MTPKAARSGPKIPFRTPSELDAVSSDFSATALVEDIALKYRQTVILHPSFVGARVSGVLAVDAPEAAVRGLAHSLGAVVFRSGPSTWYLCPGPAEPYPVGLSGSLVLMSDGRADTLAAHQVQKVRGAYFVDGYPVYLGSPVVRVPARREVVAVVERRDSVPSIPAAVKKLPHD